MNPYLDPEAITAPPQLETERLILKPVTEQLRTFVFQALSDRDVRHTMKMPALDTWEKQQSWWDRFAGWRQKGQAVQWCAFLKQTGKYVSLLTIKEIDQQHYRGELGYSVLQEEWGKGIGAEGAKRIVDYAFAEIGLHTLVAIILPYNTPSQRIVKKLGFEQEARFREHHFYEGQFYDALQFSKINPRHL